MLQSFECLQKFHLAPFQASVWFVQPIIGYLGCRLNPFLPTSQLLQRGGLAKTNLKPGGA